MKNPAEETAQNENIIDEDIQADNDASNKYQSERIINT